MSMSPERVSRPTRPSVAWIARAVVPTVLAGLALVAPSGWADGLNLVPGTFYYSTAAPPNDFSGPAPIVLALADVDATSPAPARGPVEEAVTEPVESPAPPADAPADEAPAPTREAEAPTRLADRTDRPAPKPITGAPRTPKPKPQISRDPITLAKQAIAECRLRYQHVQDYTCRFYKRERINGRLGAQNVMVMKARAKPMSIYFKFVTPNAGREAIYVAGRNGGKVIVHDVGLGKLIAGTLHLDPRGSRAMEDCRHPVTEAGIGNLIETVAERWAIEMQHGETQVVVQPGTKVGDRFCTMIESAHPQKGPDYMFHKVRLFIDQEHGLPIRFEAYDWPRRPGLAAELIEEYTYANLKLNVGLHEAAFDPNNRQYSFGRF